MVLGVYWEHDPHRILLPLTQPQHGTLYHCTCLKAGSKVDLCCIYFHMHFFLLTQDCELHEGRGCIFVL